MIFKAELNNKEDVLRWYDARENSCYIVCTGVKLDTRQIFSKWTNEDNIAGKANLEISLDFIEKNTGNINTYTIVSFPYEEGIESIKLKDIEGETIRFQFNSSTYSSVPIQSLGSIVDTDKSSNEYGKQLILMMQRQNDALLQRIDILQERIEQEEEEEEEEEEEKQLSGKDRVYGALAGLLEKPQFADTMFGGTGTGILRR